MTAEKARLADDKIRKKNWKRWGPYLSERQWATVREDYSPNGECWDYFSHDHARSRAYRWGEDGLLGITDRQCRLCLGLSLWNGKDAILKERLFGLTGSQGNHGEDCKECYYYTDSSPTHSYMSSLYKYPQCEFPYSQLEQVNRERGKLDKEYELEDTGVFDDNRYWDVQAEYAKSDDQDMLCRYTVTNAGPEEAVLWILPTLWYRNTWIWGCTHEGCTSKPKIKAVDGEPGKFVCTHETLDDMIFALEKPDEILYTENETNMQRLYGMDNYTQYTKDAFHRYIVNGDKEAVQPIRKGTKMAGVYRVVVPAGKSQCIKARLYNKNCNQDVNVPNLFTPASFNQVFTDRMKENEEFYSEVIKNSGREEKLVARQAYAGLLHSKQFYHYVVVNWLHGDNDQPTPPPERWNGRNTDWTHLFARDVISMPDKWEYPWFASWDLAFHMLPMAHVDIEFAKQQLILFLREWYMHPNGQMPAYEFAFGDVNPPVHAWAVMKVHKQTGPRGDRDDAFLARCFQKLIMNFTWWVNRKDPSGKNLFSGGFLGLDNIGIFDRSRPLPTGGQLEQADGTAWMSFFCCLMLDIALVLAESDESMRVSYEDMASKFFVHFVSIADAMNTYGEKGLWDETDGFYYDNLRFDNGRIVPLKIRSLVGLVPIFTTLVLEKDRLDKVPEFSKRCKWFVDNKPELSKRISFMDEHGGPNATGHLLALPTKNQLIRVLGYVLDEDEFLSPYGIRSLSKFHEKNPFIMYVDGEEHKVGYVPDESNTYLFGGNSNWRGPIWLCMNYLLIESLERYYYFYGDTLKVECPTHSGNMMNLKQVSRELANRLTKLFLPDTNGHRPCHGDVERYRSDPRWKDLVLFYEYFGGDSGRGLGASHQTGWTALVANCLKLISSDQEHT